MKSSSEKKSRTVGKNDSSRTARVYLSLGSNISPREDYLSRAIRQLQKNSSFHVRRVSPLYQTEPVGRTNQAQFLNCVVETQVNVSPLRLLKTLKNIERKVGRKRTLKWGPREIDIDILNYRNSIRKTKKLVIPHPFYHLRRFVLKPFSDLNPSFKHPQLKLSNRQLLHRLTVKGQRVTIVGQWKNSAFLLFKKRK